jgi:hypothetical protein
MFLGIVKTANVERVLLQGQWTIQETKSQFQDVSKTGG